MEKDLEYWKKRCELAEKVLIGRITTFKTEEKERALKFMDEIFSGLDTNKKDISDAKKAMIKNIDQMYSDKEDKQCQE